MNLTSLQGKGKGKAHPRTGHEGPVGEQRFSCTISLTSARDGECMVNAIPWLLYPRKRDSVPIVQEVEWVQKISTSLALNPQTIQPVADHYLQIN